MCVCVCKRVTVCMCLFMCERVCACEWQVPIFTEMNLLSMRSLRKTERKGEMDEITMKKIKGLIIK
jgi:hypothetical protein